MSIGTMMGAALLLLLIQLSVRGRTYGTNSPGDMLPARPNQNLAQLAERRGWSVEARWTEQRGRRQTILAPRDGMSWAYTLESGDAMLQHAIYGHTPLDGEWLDTSVRLEEGTVVIGPPESVEAIAFITGVIGFFQSDKGRSLANGLHTLTVGMRNLRIPRGRNMPFTLLSDLPVAPDLPLEIIVRHLHNWTARRPDKEEHPVITWQPTGLTVRLIRSTLDPVLTEELIDFATALRRDI